MTTSTAHPAVLDASPVDQFAELMRAFNETTGRLERTHGTLRGEVVRLRAELAEANAQLRRSQALAALGEMAAGIAHEIRNPLGSISLYVQMLAEDCRGDAGREGLCERIGRAVTGLDAIVRDVLAFAGDLRPRAGRVDVDVLIERAVADAEALIREADVTVARETARGVELVADERLIQQALGNVVRNAVEAMGESSCGGRRLEIAVTAQAVRRATGPTAPRIILAVRDSGPGIDPNVIERMFNPFFTTRATGTGLGLAIVNRIVDAHGGEVVVRNRAGGGAEVELRLPPHPGAGAPAPLPGDDS